MGTPIDVDWRQSLTTTLQLNIITKTSLYEKKECTWTLRHQTHTPISASHDLCPESAVSEAWGAAGRTKREENERRWEAVGVTQQGRRRSSAGQGRRKTAGSCGGWGNELCVPRRCVPWTCMFSGLKCSLNDLPRDRLNTYPRKTVTLRSNRVSWNHCKYHP